MATTLEEVAAEVVTIRNELNAMQTSIILTQNLVAEAKRGAIGREDEDEKFGKKVSMRIKENQGMMPKEWLGEKTGPFNDLAHDMITYMTNIFDEEASDLMNEAIKMEKCPNIEDFDDDEHPNKKFINTHLYAALTKVMHGEPKAIIRNAQRDGIAAWYRLHAHYDPRTTTDSSVSIQKVICPMRAKDGPSTMNAMERFETDIREHESKFGKINDDLKIASLKNLMPESWFDIHFKGEKFTTYEAAKSKLVNIANDRRLPRTKVNAVNEASVNYWGEQVQEEEDMLGYYGGGGYKGQTPYGKSGYKSYNPKGYGKGGPAGKGKNGFEKGWNPKGGGKGNFGKSNWYPEGGKDQGGKSKGKGFHADKDCYTCGQKGHISANCPSKGGSKGGMSSFEQEWEPETATEDGTQGVDQEVEWLGYIASFEDSWTPIPERNDKWLGCLNVMEESAGSVNAVENEAWTFPRKTAKFMKPCSSKCCASDAPTKFQFEKLKEKETEIKNELDKLKEKESEIKNEINSMEACWETVTVTVDSGAANNVAPKNAFLWIKLEENEDSRNGRFYTTANGKRVYVLGEKTVTIKTKEGIVKKIKFQICDVTRILISVGKITKADNEVVMSKTGGKIVDSKGNAIELEIENGVYIIKGSVEMRAAESQGFTRRGA